MSPGEAHSFVSVPALERLTYSFSSCCQSLRRQLETWEVQSSGLMVLGRDVPRHGDSLWECSGTITILRSGNLGHAWRCVQPLPGGTTEHLPWCLAAGSRAAVQSLRAKKRRSPMASCLFRSILYPWPRGYWSSGVIGSVMVQRLGCLSVGSNGVSTPRDLPGEAIRMAVFPAGGLGRRRGVGRGDCHSGVWLLAASLIVNRRSS